MRRRVGQQWRTSERDPARPTSLAQCSHTTAGTAPQDPSVTSPLLAPLLTNRGGGGATGVRGTADGVGWQGDGSAGAMVSFTFFLGLSSPRIKDQDSRLHGDQTSDVIVGEASWEVTYGKLPIPTPHSTLHTSLFTIVYFYLRTIYIFVLYFICCDCSGHRLLLPHAVSPGVGGTVPSHACGGSQKFDFAAVDVEDCTNGVNFDVCAEVAH